MANTSRAWAWALLVCLLLQYVSAAKVAPKIRLEDIEEENNRKAQEAKNVAVQAVPKQPVVQQQGGFLPQQYYFQPQEIARYHPQIQGPVPQQQLYLGQQEQIALLEALGQQQAQFGGVPFGHGLYGPSQGPNIPVQYSIGVGGQGTGGIPSPVAQHATFGLPAPPQTGRATVKIPAQPAPQIQYQQIQPQPALQKAAIPQAQLQQQLQEQLQRQLLAQQYALLPQQQQAAQAVAQAQLPPQQHQRVYAAQVPLQQAPQGPQYSPQQQFYQIPQYLQQLSQQPQYTQQQAQIPQQYIQQQQPQFSHQLPQQPQYTPQISPEQLQQLFQQQYPQHAAQAIQEQPKAVPQFQQLQKVVHRQPAVQRYVPEPQQQLSSSEPFKPSRPIFQQPFVYPEVVAPQRIALQALPEGGQVIYGFGGVANPFASGKPSAAEAKRAGAGVSAQSARAAALAGAAYRKGSYTPS